MAEEVAKCAAKELNSAAQSYVDVLQELRVALSEYVRATARAK